MTHPRRTFLRGGIAALLSSTLATGVARSATRAPATKAKIALIGAGQIGGTLGTLWAKAGHPVFFSSRHPDALHDLVHRAGTDAQAGTPQQAAQFADIVVLAVPYGALPGIGQTLTPFTRGKVVLDACNPYPGRDGEVGTHALQVGAGIASAAYFPGAHLVRGFNAVDATVLQSEAHRQGQPLAIPLAGDDPRAVQWASTLVRDAGFAPVIVGGLASARLFQPNGPLFEKDLTVDDMHAQLAHPA
jgi:predicted dinucleotide-binding enzyme